MGDEDQAFGFRLGDEHAVVAMLLCTAGVNLDGSPRHQRKMWVSSRSRLAGVTRYPSKAAWMSGGRGASKSSEIRTWPSHPSGLRGSSDR